jgi:hypothetical protein
MLISVVWAVLVVWLAPRKGHSRWLALLALIPCGGFLVIFYLFSITDKRVLDDIEMLKKQIGTVHGDGPKT